MIWGEDLVYWGILTPPLRQYLLYLLKKNTALFILCWYLPKRQYCLVFKTYQATQKSFQTLTELLFPFYIIVFLILGSRLSSLIILKWTATFLSEYFIPWSLFYLFLIHKSKKLWFLKFDYWCFTSLLLKLGELKKKLYSAFLYILALWCECPSWMLSSFLQTFLTFWMVKCCVLLPVCLELMRYVMLEKKDS